MFECDVLVVGAGPAGSTAARACARGGLNTVLIDKREEIGYPVRCAEGLSNYLLPFMPFKIPKEYYIWKNTGVEFWAEDLTIRRTGPTWGGYTVNRRRFDKYLASLATASGAHLMRKTELKDFEFGDRHMVEKALLNSDGKKVVLKPKVVIGADGYDSTTLKFLGEYKPKAGATAEVYSYEMHKLDLISPQYEQVFIGDFTATGYAYVFPIGKNKANIGVGCAKPAKPMEEYFNEFLEIPEMKHQVKNAVRIEDKGGKANVLRISDRSVYGNVILTGDAADQNLKPFVEGIIPAIICGDIAGKAVAAHIKQNRPLKDYPLDVRKKLGDFFEESDTAAMLIYDLFHMNQPKAYLLMLALLADIESGDKIKELKKRDYNSLRDEILEWNNWHKQTIANSKETFYYELERGKQAINRIWN